MPVLPIDIFDDSPFDEKALRVFQYQVENNNLYGSFVKSLGLTAEEVKTLKQVPFLPVSFFKTHKIYTGHEVFDTCFISSGTTGETSRHYITDLSIYRQSFFNGFELYYGDVKQYSILALLPSYLERGDSSLVYMCDHLIKESRNPSSGFYLNELEALSKVLSALKKNNQPVILIGVTYALLDLASQFPMDFPELIIVETGGMKGRRKEMIREEMHDVLKNAFNVRSIHSEYGMTELLSQAWSKGNGIYNCPPWMRIMIRSINDPFEIVEDQKTGGINIIDLANIHSCSFIATQDLGRLNKNSFEVLGRFDNSDLRGCNLMIE